MSATGRRCAWPPSIVSLRSRPQSPVDPRVIGPVFRACAFFFRLNLHFQGNLAMEILISILVATIATVRGAVYGTTLLIANEAVMSVLHSIVAKMELHARSAFRVLSALYRPLQSVKIAVL